MPLASTKSHLSPCLLNAIFTKDCVPSNLKQKSSSREISKLCCETLFTGQVNAEVSSESTAAGAQDRGDRYRLGNH